MRLMVLRSAEQADALAGLLAQSGHEAIIAPVMALVDLVAGPLPLDGVGALIATSQNAFAAASRAENLATARALPLYAVGAATAAAAQALGFSSIVVAAGTAAELEALLIREHDSKRGALLHLAGEHLAHDLAPGLARAGMDYRVLPVYAMRAVDQLPDAARHVLLNRACDGVIALSPRQAAIFVALVRNARLETEARRLPYFCLSEAVATALQSLAPMAVFIAPEPNLPHLLARINQEFGLSGHTYRQLQ